MGSFGSFNARVNVGPPRARRPAPKRTANVRFPIPSSDLPPAGRNGFAARYRTAKSLFRHWQQAGHEHRHLVLMPAVFSHAWINALARALFGVAGQFREPADLLALSQAVREMACEGVTPKLGRGIDAGDITLTVYELEHPIPQSPQARLLGHCLPHIDDALYLLGERSRRIEGLVVAWFDWRHLLTHLNGHIEEELALDPWIRRYAFRADDGPFAHPRLVRPLPWPESMDEPFEPLRLPRDPFDDSRWDRVYARLTEEGLPQWRRRLLDFCREAVYELAHRGYPVDPLPAPPTPGDTFESLADQLLMRANQAVRHAGGGPIEPIPGWDWWFQALPPRGAYGRILEPHWAAAEGDTVERANADDAPNNNAEPEVGQAPEHADDFSWVKCKHGEFTFTSAQRTIIAALWADWEKQGKGLSGPHLVKLLSSVGSKIRDKFKHNSAWNTLIIKATERVSLYRLDL